MAVLPHPPLLVPEVAAGASDETEPLRAACRAGAAALAEVAQRWVAVVAADPAEPIGVAGTFAGYGADVPVALGPSPCASVQARLPLPLLVAGWLRETTGDPRITVSAAAVAPGSPTADCVRIGRELAARLDGDEPVAVLVLGDGAATHTLKAPGYFDERAAGFDRAVADGLERADPEALLRLDSAVAAQLKVAGREAWQVGAAAARAACPDWRGELLYSDAPYGVAYHVAVWRPCR